MSDIQFKQLADALLDRAETLVPKWLPGGRRDGHEWRCGGVNGDKGDSMGVNLVKGVWSDFATGEKGGDLTSLYAAIFGMTQADAARDLADSLNLSGIVPSNASAPGGARASHQSPKVAPAPVQRPAGEKGEFVPVVPVPDYAPAPPTAHPFRGTPSHVWRYVIDGALQGFVYRFVTSDGGKEVLPLTWCQSQADGTQKWTWKTWAEPRPLYLPSGLSRATRSHLPMVVVEGEKCADALHAVTSEVYDSITWQGGGKAVGKAGWDVLKPAADATERRVYLWPDCDAKRRKLTPEEVAAGVDKDSVDLLPVGKQPGVSAMATLAPVLHDLGLEVWVCQIPAPGAVVDGWDCFDAIAEGWEASHIADFLAQAVRWVPPESAVKKNRPGAGADPGDPQGWRMALIKSSEGAIKVIRENVVLALQCIPEVSGQIAFNEFANDVIKLSPMPWGSPAGKWSEVDELLMGEWLCRSHFLPSMPRGTLEEAVRMVAQRHQYHPVRQYLESVTWDGNPRLNTWLAHVVTTPAELTKKKEKYLARVGAWFLMAMAARALEPGCKFDYMPIFEGNQGMRKSTLLAVLGGEWFADTGFVLGDKDSLQGLQGRWMYEISELDAMARAEVTKIKAFVASQKDWFRASFDKRPREYKRQLVFAGTTNEHQYLVDGTGNRRFWPVEVTRVIDTEWVAANRDQLFAEAVVRFRSGERFHPTTREEVELFLPQQRERMVESPIEVKILDYLVNNLDGQLLKQVQIVTLLAAIHIDITKLGPGRFHEKQAGTALRKFGWARKRSSLPGRPWVYLQPDNWPDCMNLDDLDDSGLAVAPVTNQPASEQAINHDNSDVPF